MCLRIADLVGVSEEACSAGGIGAAYFYFEEVLWRAIDLLECL
jgi:hypothetical protein